MLMRAGTEYFLRTVMLLSEMFEGDLTRAVVFLTINAANTGYLLDDPELDRHFASEDAYVPDEVRRPITRTAVSNAARIPFETARRHCNALIADGWCKDLGPRGLIVNIERRDDPRTQRLRGANAMNLRRLLRRVGADIGE
jgi:hypothetical protein